MFHIGRVVHADAAVLSHYEGVDDAIVVPLGHGLINETFLVVARERKLVLQRVNPIFAPGIHSNIAAVTDHLARAGMESPRLLRSRAGEHCVDLGPGGLWRLMTHVDGSCFDVVHSPAQARSAGELVGRFHAALDDLEHDFVDLRVGVHDTPAHLEKLRRALVERPQHRLHAAVNALGSEILEAADSLDVLPRLADRICHGDLKLNNVMFAGPEPPAALQARCLIDLDTVGPMHLAYEMGDALRSWCNPGGEDEGTVRFDLDVCGEALDGYREGLGRDPSEPERVAILLGVEWVSLELAARFAADALLETYFGWDERRFAGRGEHNLTRARSQWALYRAARATRAGRRRQLGL